MDLCQGMQEKKEHITDALKLQIYMKIVTQGLLGSLITDLNSDFKNSIEVYYYSKMADRGL